LRQRGLRSQLKLGSQLCSEYLNRVIDVSSVMSATRLLSIAAAKHTSRHFSVVPGQTHRPRFTAVQPNDDKGIEQIETNGRNNEQIHGGNIRRMITQEGLPSLRWWCPTLDRIFGYCRLSEFKSELE
jgi:hypothetical protein